MIENYPMRTVTEAEASIKRALADRFALRISAGELKAIRDEFSRRLMQMRKAALLSSAASFSVKSSEMASRQRGSRGR